MQTTLQSDVKVYLCDALPTSGSFNEGDIALVFNFTSGIMGYRCMTAGSPGTWWKFGQMGMTDDIATTASTPPTQDRYKRNGQYMMVGGRPSFYYGSLWRDGMGNYFGASHSGTTANRPQNVQPGFFYYDTTIGKPIWYKGSGTWVNASGQTV